MSFFKSLFKRDPLEASLKEADKRLADYESQLYAAIKKWLASPPETWRALCEARAHAKRRLLRVAAWGAYDLLPTLYKLLTLQMKSWWLQLVLEEAALRALREQLAASSARRAALADIRRAASKSSKGTGAAQAAAAVAYTAAPPELAAPSMAELEAFCVPPEAVVADSTPVKRLQRRLARLRQHLQELRESLSALQPLLEESSPEEEGVGYARLLAGAQAAELRSQCLSADLAELLTEVESSLASRGAGGGGGGALPRPASGSSVTADDATASSARGSVPPLSALLRSLSGLDRLEEEEEQAWFAERAAGEAAAASSGADWEPPPYALAFKIYRNIRRALAGAALHPLAAHLPLLHRLETRVASSSSEFAAGLAPRPWLASPALSLPSLLLEAGREPPSASASATAAQPWMPLTPAQASLLVFLRLGVALPPYLAWHVQGLVPPPLDRAAHAFFPARAAAAASAAGTGAGAADGASSELSSSSSASTGSLLSSGLCRLSLLLEAQAALDNEAAGRQRDWQRLATDQRRTPGRLLQRWCQKTLAQHIYTSLAAAQKDKRRAVKRRAATAEAAGMPPPLQPACHAVLLGQYCYDMPRYMGFDPGPAFADSVRAQLGLLQVLVMQQPSQATQQVLLAPAALVFTPAAGTTETPERRSLLSSSGSGGAGVAPGSPGAGLDSAGAGAGGGSASPSFAASIAGAGRPPSAAGRGRFVLPAGSASQASAPTGFSSTALQRLSSGGQPSAAAPGSPRGPTASVSSVTSGMQPGLSAQGSAMSSAPNTPATSSAAAAARGLLSIINPALAVPLLLTPTSIEPFHPSAMPALPPFLQALAVAPTVPRARPLLAFAKYVAEEIVLTEHGGGAVAAGGTRSKSLAQRFLRLLRLQQGLAGDEAGSGSEGEDEENEASAVSHSGEPAWTLREAKAEALRLCCRYIERTIFPRVHALLFCGVDAVGPEMSESSAGSGSSGGGSGSGAGGITPSAGGSRSSVMGAGPQVGGSIFTGASSAAAAIRALDDAPSEFRQLKYYYSSAAAAQQQAQQPQQQAQVQMAVAAVQGAASDAATTAPGSAASAATTAAADVDASQSHAAAPPPASPPARKRGVFAFLAALPAGGSSNSSGAGGASAAGAAAQPSVEAPSAVDASVPASSTGPAATPRLRQARIATEEAAASLHTSVISLKTRLVERLEGMAKSAALLGRGGDNSGSAAAALLDANMPPGLQAAGRGESVGSGMDAARAVQTPDAAAGTPSSAAAAAALSPPFSPGGAGADAPGAASERRRGGSPSRLQLQAQALAARLRAATANALSSASRSAAPLVVTTAAPTLGTGQPVTAGDDVASAAPASSSTDSATSTGSAGGSSTLPPTPNAAAASASAAASSSCETGEQEAGAVAAGLAEEEAAGAADAGSVAEAAAAAAAPAGPTPAADAAMTGSRRGSIGEWVGGLLQGVRSRRASSTTGSAAEADAGVPSSASNGQRGGAAAGGGSAAAEHEAGDATAELLPEDAARWLPSKVSGACDSETLGAAEMDSPALRGLLEPTAASAAAASGAAMTPLQMLRAAGARFSSMANNNATGVTGAGGSGSGASSPALGRSPAASRRSSGATWSGQLNSAAVGSLPAALVLGMPPPQQTMLQALGGAGAAGAELAAQGSGGDALLGGASAVAATQVTGAAAAAAVLALSNTLAESGAISSTSAAVPGALVLPGSASDILQRRDTLFLRKRAKLRTAFYASALPPVFCADGKAGSDGSAGNGASGGGQAQQQQQQQHLQHLAAEPIGLPAAFLAPLPSDSLTVLLPLTELEAALDAAQAAGDSTTLELLLEALSRDEVVMLPAASGAPGTGGHHACSGELAAGAAAAAAAAATPEPPQVPCLPIRIASRPFSAAAGLLTHVEACEEPAEALAIFMAAVDVLVTEAQARAAAGVHAAWRSSGDNSRRPKSPPPLAADDLVPLLIYTLMESGLSRPHACVSYLSTYGMAAAAATASAGAGSRRRALGLAGRARAAGGSTGGSTGGSSGSEAYMLTNLQMALDWICAYRDSRGAAAAAAVAGSGGTQGQRPHSVQAQAGGRAGTGGETCTASASVAAGAGSMGASLSASTSSAPADAAGAPGVVDSFTGLAAGAGAGAGVEAQEAAQQEAGAHAGASLDSAADVRMVGLDAALQQLGKRLAAAQAGASDAASGSEGGSPSSTAGSEEHEDADEEAYETETAERYQDLLEEGEGAGGGGGGSGGGGSGGGGASGRSTAGEEMADLRAFLQDQQRIETLLRMYA